MKALKISKVRIVPGIYQSVVSGTDQFGETSTQYRLFAKQVGFSLFPEISFQDARACPAYAFGIGKGYFSRVFGDVLVNRHQAGNACALFIGPSDQMSRTFWSDHENIDKFWWDNLPKMNIESMSPCEGHAFSQMRFDILFIHGPLLVIGNQDHQDIGFFCSFRNGHDVQSILLGSFPESTIFSKTNDNFYSTIMKISSMGMPLASITNNGNCFLLYEFDVHIFVIKNLRQNSSPYILFTILVD